MTEDTLQKLRRLLAIIKRAHDYYVKAKTFKEGTAILEGCEKVISRLNTEFGVDKTWLESAIIFGGEFVKAEKKNMFISPVKKEEKINNEQMKL